MLLLKRRKSVSEFKGKGSRQRPENHDRFASEFDRIFGVKTKPVEQVEPKKDEKK